MRSSLYALFLSACALGLTGFGGANPPGVGFEAASTLHTGPIGRGATIPGLDACGEIPASAIKAYREAQFYRNGCPHIRQAQSKPIMINDYTTTGTAYSYVFQDGNCMGKARVAWGGGGGRAPGSRQKPYPCSTSESKFTPPGFHLTAVKASKGKYGPHDSIALVGLDGQKSVQRGVVMHAVGYNPVGNTFGCPAFKRENFRALQNSIPTGSLVYNYFGGTQTPAVCNNSAGMRPDPSKCLSDGGGGGPSRRYVPKRQKSTR